MASASTWPTESGVFTALFEAGHIGVTATDASGVILSVNRAALAQSGFTADELVGIRLGGFGDATGKPMIRAALAAARRGDAFQGSLNAVRKDGSTLRLRVTTVPVTSGPYAGTVFFQTEDISAQRDAEDRFRSLFEHSPVVAVAIAPDGTFVDVNPAGLAISGFAKHEIFGHRFHDFVHPDDLKRVLAAFHKTLGGESLTLDLRAFHRSGGVLHYKAQFMPMVERSIVTGVYVLLEDVSERVESAETIAEQRRDIVDREQLFQSLFEYNPDGVVALDGRGQITAINDAGLALGGNTYTREQVVGAHFSDFLAPAESQRMLTYLSECRSGIAVSFEIDATQPGGSPLLLGVTMIPNYHRGEVRGTYSILQNVTKRREAERLAERQAQRMRDLYVAAARSPNPDQQILATLEKGCALFSASSGIIVETDGRDIRVDLRYDAQAPPGGDELGDGEVDVPAVVAQIMNANETVVSKEWIGTKLLVAGEPYGAIYFVRPPRAAPLERIDGDTLSLMATLIGTGIERRSTRAHLRTLAYFDALTGLPNRLQFRERLRDELDRAGRAGTRLSILFFDLDRFKDVNDTFGHAVGDTLLQQVAQRLVECAGPRCTVARMGGDEFFVLVPDTPLKSDIEPMVRRLMARIDEPYNLNQYEQFITASVGIATYPTDGRDDLALIKSADIAMYRAKDRGRDGFAFYEPVLEESVQMRISQQKQLRRALETHQFVIHYQPIVNLKDGDISGLEALVRWNHPQHGLMYPNAFIPGAEASGLIVSIGDWVLTTAAAQVAQWQRRFGPMRLAVNVSARQFHQRDLTSRIETALASSGLAPNDLEVEITESVAMVDPAHAIQVVRELKSRGVRIVVDDFGTGHSAFSYLRRFDVDVMKIDRTFIDGICKEADDEIIVKTLIAMGHNLGLIVVAEGVETEAQYAFLAEHRCDRIQGFCVEFPLDAERMEQFIATRRGTRPRAG